MSRRDVTSTTQTHGDVLTAISKGMVVLLKEFYGRGPTRAKTYYEDDLVVCLLRGGYSRVEQIGRVEDEDLAHDVGILLVAAHEADHSAACGILDHRDEALAHQLLELHPLLDHRVAAPALQQCLFDARVAPAQQANLSLIHI